jgi:hypothetical protein
VCAHTTQFCLDDHAPSGHIDLLPSGLTIFNLVMFIKAEGELVLSRARWFYR